MSLLGGLLGSGRAALSRLLLGLAVAGAALWLQTRLLGSIFGVPAAAEPILVSGIEHAQAFGRMIEAVEQPDWSWLVGAAVWWQQWGLAASGALLLGGLLLSPRPLRSLGWCIGISGALLLLAPILLGLLADWITAGPLAEFALLVQPLFDAALLQLGSWSTPAGIAAAIAGAVLISVSLATAAAGRGPQHGAR